MPSRPRFLQEARRLKFGEAFRTPVARPLERGTPHSKCTGPTQRRQVSSKFWGGSRRKRSLLVDVDVARAAGTAPFGGGAHSFSVGDHDSYAACWGVGVAGARRARSSDEAQKRINSTLKQKETSSTVAGERPGAPLDGRVIVHEARVYMHEEHDTSQPGTHTRLGWWWGGTAAALTARRRRKRRASTWRRRVGRRRRMIFSN